MTWTAKRFAMALALSVAVVAIAMTGCWSGVDDEMVVFAALDREFSEPILEQFTARTNIQVLPVYDKEAQKNGWPDEPSSGRARSTLVRRVLEQ
jgi:flagellar biosynthesis/type III secretory pathway M-ring protein FliF/YscJ